MQVEHCLHGEAMEAGGCEFDLTTVGQVFSPTRHVVRFSHLNVPFFQNSEFIWNIVPVRKR